MLTFMLIKYQLYQVSMIVESKNIHENVDFEMAAILIRP